MEPRDPIPQPKENQFLELNSTPHVRRVTTLTNILSTRHMTSLFGPTDRWDDELTSAFPRCSPETQRDIILTIKARNHRGANKLMEMLGRKDTEVVFPQFGTYVVPPPYRMEAKHIPILQNPGTTVIVSTPNWDQAKKDIANFEFGKSIALLPEIITVGGLDLDDKEGTKKTAQNAVQEALELTKAQPDATFVIGSPHYVDGVGKPYNGVFVMKDGKIITVGHKRFGSSGEDEWFTMDASAEQPTTLGSSSILVCSDINGARTAHFQKSELKTSSFVSPESNTVLAPTCWGVGINESFYSEGKDRAQDKIDHTYQMFMKAAVHGVLDIFPNLTKVVVSDTTDSSEWAKSHMVASRPSSMVAFRRTTT